VFENRILWNIFGPKGEEVTGDGRRLYNVQLSNFYPSENIIGVIKQRKIRWAEHVARMAVLDRFVHFWWGNLKDSPLRRHRSRWDYSIKTAVLETV